MSHAKIVNGVINRFMRRLIVKHWLRVGYATSFAVYFLSLLLTVIDRSFSLRWAVLSLHLSAVVLAASLYFVSRFHPRPLRALFQKKEIIPFVTVLVITLILNFSYIKDLSFVSLGDEVRDGGLYAAQILGGSIKQLYAYGRYEAHGLIIPILVTPFYYLFGPNVYSFRVPAALLASFDVLFVYLILRLLTNRISAVVGALVLASLPLHLFFARSQVVIAFSMFWTSALLLYLIKFFKKRTLGEYVMLGLALGFISSFHVSVRVVVCCIFAYVCMIDILNRFSKKRISVPILYRYGVLIAYFLVGFGPQVFITSFNLFLHT
ncbi:glycosyltransferase family 39 protein, partial [Candidatus Roizmanbacteria bacterium]|nr:glycosyltransferase family 39 protein [Candidatus Roizmanbacteria bacterium]